MLCYYYVDLRTFNWHNMHHLIMESQIFGNISNYELPGLNCR